MEVNTLTLVIIVVLILFQTVITMGCFYFFTKKRPVDSHTSEDQLSESGEPNRSEVLSKLKGIVNAMEGEGHGMHGMRGIHDVHRAQTVFDRRSDPQWEEYVKNIIPQVEDDMIKDHFIPALKEKLDVFDHQWGYPTYDDVKKWCDDDVNAYPGAELKITCSKCGASAIYYKDKLISHDEHRIPSSCREVLMDEALQ